MTIDIKVEVGRHAMNFNTGYLAKQADGAVAVSYGEVVVFATAVASKDVKEGQDFFPLTVDYREKAYAAGKIPGGFIKRESRPSDKEVLVSRLTDRPLRPLFPEDFVNSTGNHLCASPTGEPAGRFVINGFNTCCFRYAVPRASWCSESRENKRPVIVNPTFKEMDESDIDLVVAGTRKAVTMIEGCSKNVSEDMLAAVVLP